MIKKIECYVPREKVEVLKNELIHAGVYGMSVSDVRGFGRHLSAAATRGPAGIRPHHRVGRDLAHIIHAMPAPACPATPRRASLGCEGRKTRPAAG